MTEDADHLTGRLQATDWSGIHAELHAHGYAVLPDLLTSRTCRTLAALYPQREHFRSRVFTNVHNLAGGIDAWSKDVDPSVPRY